MKISKEARACVAEMDDALGFLTEIERPILAQHLQSLINSTLDRAAAALPKTYGPAMDGYQLAYDRGIVACRAIILALKEDTQ